MAGYRRSLKRQIGKKVYKFPKALNFNFYASMFRDRLKRLKAETAQRRDMDRQIKLMDRKIDRDRREAAKVKKFWASHIDAG